jgi:hypothetical protein
LASETKPVRVAEKGEELLLPRLAGLEELVSLDDFDAARSTSRIPTRKRHGGRRFVAYVDERPTARNFDLAIFAEEIALEQDGGHEAIVSRRCAGGK